MKFIVAISLVLFSLSANAAPQVMAGQNSKAPISIDADSLDVDQNDKTAVFSGNVIAKQGDITIRSDKMKVFYAGGDKSKNSISKIEVDGNVFLTTQAEKAKSSHAVYDTVKNVVTMTDNVELTKDQTILKGNQLYFDMTSGRSRLDTGGAQGSGGRVRGLFIPQ